MGKTCYNETKMYVNTTVIMMICMPDVFFRKELQFMTREELIEYISEAYDSDPDYPWEKDSKSAVFRHPNNKKWFALIMNIPRERVAQADLNKGPEKDSYFGKEKIDVVNMKCDPVLIGYLIKEPGFYPAYHMNKNHWITALLDGTASDSRIKEVLDLSFTVTTGKGKSKNTFFKENITENT